jgi:hypothetical protein
MGKASSQPALVINMIWIAQDIKVIALELELYYLQQKRAYLMLRQDPWEDGIPMHFINT